MPRLHAPLIRLRFRLLLATTLLAGLTACGTDDAVDALDTVSDTASGDATDTTGGDTVETDTGGEDTAESDATDTGDDTTDTSDATDTTADATDTSGDATGDASDLTDTEPPPPADLPSHDELAEGWNVLWPEGATICSRGTPFGFAVYKGRTDRVVIDFIGGGACWNALTCSANEQLSIFSDTVDDVLNAAENGQIEGIYRHDRTDNPFADWTHVVIPYCTGDIHWGDSVTTYPPLGDNPPVTIHHKGGVNSRAVLDWVYENITAPDKLFVTGCSAGSYGSIMWSAHIMDHYPQASVYQFGDSGAGVITEDFFADSFPAWNAQSSFPDWLPGLDPTQVDILSLELADLYEGIGAGNPGQVISQFNTRLDDNQTFYYDVMGGEGGAEGWSQRMLASIERIEASTPNFHSYLAEGERHCIVIFDEFYTQEVNGVLLPDWLNSMVNDEPLESQACELCTTTPPVP